MKINAPLSLAALALALAACGSADGDARTAPTGRVIEVKMVTDEKGNLFEPSQVTARRGDVLRFTLVTGVHGVTFPADGSGRPASSALLDHPGQTHDVPVTFAPGTYAFRCDPHVALEMVGTLVVE